MSNDSMLSRRDWMTLAAAGVGGASLSGWLGVLAGHARAAAPPARGKSCILLWMDGGPSHIDTFDPKPDADETYRGDLASIPTNIAGVRACEKFPKMARLMQHAAILRSMSTQEADHGRARIHLHTGYRPAIGGVTYPVLGATVSAELGRDDSSLPNFVVTGAGVGKFAVLGNPGYRGPRHQPLVVADPKRGLEDLKPATSAADFDDRADVLNQLEQGFARTHGAGPADAHNATFQAALRLMRSEQAKAFDLSQEPEAAARPYGDSKFGRCCLLARRLVEVGVRFVEVNLPGWDTHAKPAADNAKALMTHVDDGMSALIGDLHARGRLADTLVVWMGEFGRTPKVNRNAGRDHYARAWSTVLAGGGIKGGQVIGKTDDKGAAVTERPISVRDFMATVCQILGIDYAKKVNTPIGRPIRIVEAGEKPIRELLG